VPELIQGEFTPEAVAAEAASLLTDRARAETMRRDLAAVRATLGSPGASRRAAWVVGDGGFFHRSGPEGAGGREGK
jgi:lipid-A-disaccharide synthase